MPVRPAAFVKKVARVARERDRVDVDALGVGERHRHVKVRQARPNLHAHNARAGAAAREGALHGLGRNRLGVRLAAGDDDERGAARLDRRAQARKKAAFVERLPRLERRNNAHDAAGLELADVHALLQVRQRDVLRVRVQHAVDEDRPRGAAGGDERAAGVEHRHHRRRVGRAEHVALGGEQGRAAEDVVGGRRGGVAAVGGGGGLRA